MSFAKWLTKLRALCARLRASRFAHVPLMAATIIAVCASRAGATETPLEVDWIRQLGTSSHDSASSVVVDGGCNVLLGASLGSPNASNYDVYLVKYSSTGMLLWTRQLGTTGHDFASSVAVDSADSVFICGDTHGSLGGTNAGGHDAFIAKYSDLGAPLWIRQLGTSSNDSAGAVAVDTAGNILISGWTLGSLSNPNAGGSDSFVAKFSASGALLWIRQIGTIGDEYAHAVAVDADGSAFISGYTKGSLGSPSAGNYDAYIAKYSAQGTLLWTRQIGTIGDEYAYAVAVDGAGNAFISGSTGGSLGGPNAGGNDAFIAKYSPSGLLLWTRQLGTSSGDFAYSVAVDSSGHSYISGTTGGTLGGPNAGFQDAFLAKYSSSGSLLWTQQLVTSTSEQSFSVSVDNAGDAYLSGTTSGSIGGPNAGGGDAFVAKYTGSLEILDPNESTGSFLVDGSVVNDPMLLAELVAKCQGLAADGVTRIVIRHATSGSGTVLFSLNDESERSADIGSLSSLGGNQEVTTLSVPTTNVNGQHMAFAVLRASADFVREPQDLAAASRLINISAAFTPSRGGSPTITSRSIVLRRPPVVLLHGLWSRDGTWTWSLKNDPRFTVHAHNYESTNAAHFESNINQPKAAVASAVAMMRSQGIAATQADVIGHSMGGLLSRLYASEQFSSDYFRNENFNAGDIHKLITVDTPHTGSPLAVWLVDSSGTKKWLGDVLEDVGPFGCMGCGAVLDLRWDNPLFAALPAANVPAHAIVGKGGSDLIQEGIEATLPPGVQLALDILALFGLDDLFPPALQHDLIVGRLSQEGGLTGSQTSLFGVSMLPPSLGLHFTVTKESAIGARAIELLNTHIDDNAVFASGFPAATGGVAGGDEVLPPLPDIGALPIQLAIVSPRPGEVFEAGESIQVVVEGIDDYMPQMMAVVSEHDSELIEAAPFSTTLEIPAEALGQMTISAWANDGNRNFAAAAPVTVQVQTSAELIALAVEPTVMYLFDFAPSQGLTVVGTFDDDVERSLTSAEFGTTYQSEDETIAQIDANGIVTAIADGTTSIFAFNGQFDAMSVVHVSGIVNACPADFVTSATFQPPGDSQVDGADLAYLLGEWGANPGSLADIVTSATFQPPPDGIVDGADLAVLLGAWGPCE